MEDLFDFEVVCCAFLLYYGYWVTLNCDKRQEGLPLVQSYLWLVSSLFCNATLVFLKVHHLRLSFLKPPPSILNFSLSLFLPGSFPSSFHQSLPCYLAPSTFPQFIPSVVAAVLYILPLSCTPRPYSFWSSTALKSQQTGYSSIRLITNISGRHDPEISKRHMGPVHGHGKRFEEEDRSEPGRTL